MQTPTQGDAPPPGRIEFGLVTGQHRRDWDELLEQWHFSEATGWDSAWAFDHFFSLDDDELGPCLEGWTLLAGLAARVPRLQLGLLVNGNTHRNPAVLAKQAVTVDVISGGRLILGVGAAWNEREHAAYGIPFPSARERVDRFGEAMEVQRLLENQERATFHGDYYQLGDAPFEPKPVNGHIPVLIGSTGKRMLRHVARYADLWDGGGSPEEYRALGERLSARCREIGRDPSEIRWVYSTGGDPLESEDALRTHVTRYAAVGVRTFLFDMPNGAPSVTLRDLSERVLPELRAEFSNRSHNH